MQDFKEIIRKLKSDSNVGVVAPDSCKYVLVNSKENGYGLLASDAKVTYLPGNKVYYKISLIGSIMDYIDSIEFFDTPYDMFRWLTND